VKVSSSIDAPESTVILHSTIDLDSGLGLFYLVRACTDTHQRCFLSWMVLKLEQIGHQHIELLDVTG
jgi:hypothetical protein